MGARGPKPKHGKPIGSTQRAVECRRRIVHEDGEMVAEFCALFEAASLSLQERVLANSMAMRSIRRLKDRAERAIGDDISAGQEMSGGNNETAGKADTVK